jgi:hypothetical protein
MLIINWTIRFKYHYFKNKSILASFYENFENNGQNFDFIKVYCDKLAS